MTRNVSLGVEQLESRDTPSGMSFASGVFLPPGLDRGIPQPVYLPPPVTVGRDGAIAFLPPGLDRAYPDHNNAPPPVEVGRDGSITFLPPGLDRADRAAGIWLLHAPTPVQVGLDGSIAFLPPGASHLTGPGPIDRR